jgi:uncharacterized membrane protein (DUF485 family)
MPERPGDIENNSPPQITPNWDRIAASKEFQNLLAKKRQFIFPTFIFFFVYFFSLPILIGYAPKLMSTPILGAFTAAYAFALSQFLVGWLIAALYLRASKKFDRLAKEILAQSITQQGGK